MNSIHSKSSRGELESIDDPISFPPINSNRVIGPHYDALVLTLCINDFDVHRVLVDPGSATDLLQLPAFRQMKLFMDKLNSVGCLLSGFNRATTFTLGDIMLPVKASPVTEQVLFLVIADLGPYNAIISHAWLHSMKAVPSTYHQMVSYQMNAGHIDLLSSQLASRQCYQLFIQE